MELQELIRQLESLIAEDGDDSQIARAEVLTGADGSAFMIMIDRTANKVYLL